LGIHSSNLHFRERIALICQGTGWIVGTCNLVDFKGPLSIHMYHRNAKRSGLNRDEIGPKLPYRKTFAWILANPKRFRKPLPYKYPVDALIWTTLPDTILPSSIHRMK
jgi:hypothetical protein